MTEKFAANDSEISKLWIEYQTNHYSNIREKLIGHYLPLVKLVASRVAIALPQHVERDDLVSCGYFGLMEAIERFDPSRNIKFETYAVARVRGAILDFIRAQDWLPTSIRQKGRQYEKVVSKLESQLGRSATDYEIAESMGITLGQYNALVQQLNASTLVPLEEFLQTESAVNENDTNPTKPIETEEVKSILAKAIDKLPDKERVVVSLYYYEGLTLKEICLVLKLSEARISQLHTKAIFRLRGALSRMKASLL